MVASSSNAETAVTNYGFQEAIVCPSLRGGIAIVRGVSMRQTFVIYVR